MMPSIVVCGRCGSAHWADRRCAACERAATDENARLYGTSFVRISRCGRVERVDPPRVRILEEGA